MRTSQIKFFVIFLFVTFSKNPFYANEVPEKDRFVVVLDAGHGGKDPGNMGNGYKEKDIALSIILKIGKELESQGVEVIYTRKTDVFIPLKKRTRIANEAKADLFVSVHCNAHSSQANGTETFVLGLRRSNDNLEIAKRENSVIYLEDDYEVTYNGFDPNSPESYIGLALMQEEYLNQSILLADFIQKKFTNELRRKNRGVKQDVFLVLREAVMPSVLIETGFLTNNNEGAFLNSGNGQNKMATAISQAIINYSENINLSTLESIEETRGNIESTPVASSVYDNIIFKVQLAAGSKKVETNSYNFRGLENVSRAKEGKLFKYYLGETSNYFKIQELHQHAITSGYSSSYIVAFKDGRKITVNEALKSKVN
ncbi:N-acetylmuramoyl-L-alanine amidase family protein [Autumnicola edwardsiae]|uniref:N-acetylmuramoyl-L-alanine amidase n=1 Tax=Autumnicola edwardsiae TaxID=3075594 RepID=A0ABU3CWH3_9FLAO|nr:N-acetylmuramoyl-L-alanine amidase [Zunongwangia sp. F297]MDT0650717.1 N-acetylmuramoyl-L-alanine amidase [Zunongwangia sp. F297]